MRNPIALLALTALYLVFAFTLAISATSFSLSSRTRQDPSETAKIVRMKVTAYCPCKICCGKWADTPPSERKTSAGRDPFIADGVASDPAVLPFGTRVIIPGAGERIVDDRLSKKIIEKDRKAGIPHIDLRVVVRGAQGKVNLAASHARADAWKTKWLDVEILERKKR